MVAKKTSRFASKFKNTFSYDSRIENVRKERSVKDDQPKLSLNFKDFDSNQCPPGQTFEEWQEQKCLSVLMQKFVDICAYNVSEALQKGLLKIYGDFPAKSDFTKPSYIMGDVQWGTIQRIGGQKPRLAGYIIGSVFYPVFLDKEHRFFISTKKHT